MGRGSRLQSLDPKQTLFKGRLSAAPKAPAQYKNIDSKELHNLLTGLLMSFDEDSFNQMPYQLQELLEKVRDTMTTDKLEELNNYQFDPRAWARPENLKIPEDTRELAYNLKSLVLWPQVRTFRKNELGQMIRNLKFEGDDCRRTFIEEENNQSDPAILDWYGVSTHPKAGTVNLRGTEYSYDVLYIIKQQLKSKGGFSTENVVEDFNAHFVGDEVSHEYIKANLDKLVENNLLTGADNVYLVLGELEERFHYFLMED